jgi:hypothetical protein
LPLLLARCACTATFTGLVSLGATIASHSGARTIGEGIESHFVTTLSFDPLLIHRTVSFLSELFAAGYRGGCSFVENHSTCCKSYAQTLRRSQPLHCTHVTHTHFQTVSHRLRLLGLLIGLVILTAKGGRRGCITNALVTSHQLPLGTVPPLHSAFLSASFNIRHTYCS